MTLSRKMGYSEKLCSILHDQADRTTNISSVVELTGNLDHDKLIASLRQVIANQPCLRVTRRIEDSEYFFDCHDEIQDLPIEFLQSKSKTYWQNIVECGLEIYYQNNHPRWRLYVINSAPETNHLVFACSHANGDGISVIAFFHELLGTYAGIAGFPCHHFLPCTEALAQHLNEGPLPPPKDFQQTPWFYDDKGMQEKQHTSKLKYFNLTQQQTKNLLEKAKSNGVSVNSYINAILLLTAVTVQRSPLSLTFMTPVDLRPYTKPAIPENYFGHYAGVTITHHNIKPSDNLADIARDYQNQLHKQIPQHIISPLNLSLEDADAIVKPRCDASDRFSIGLCSSNMGRIDFNTQFGDIKLESIYMSGARNSGDLPLL